MVLDALDRARMLRALELAEQAIPLSDPNPRVGCVLANTSGDVVIEGFTQAPGGQHAEAHALAQAANLGVDLRGGCAWVTLEPCAHHGRTPPCCDALAAAGLSRVVVAVGDPFPRVAGEGLRRLHAAGMQVVLLADDDPLSQAARELNVGFFSRIERGRPWVRMKMATSLDGRSALNNGVSQWITGEASRIDGHRWRRRASAILTGIGTVLADRPRLDVRLVETTRQPLRVVLDSSLRTPLEAPILQPPGQCLVITTRHEATREAQLAATGAIVLRAPPDSQDRVDLRWLMQQLAEQDVNEVHVEAGATLNGALLEQRAVDELLIYQAPLFLGPGRGSVDWAERLSLEGGIRFRYVAADPIGHDLRLRLMSR